MVLDACHSGTGCDLRYKYDDASYLTNNLAKLPEKYVPNDWSLQQTSYEFKRYSKTAGEVFCISGCQDEQTSADAFLGGQASGVLTHLLLNCLNTNSQSTYKWKHLLKDICCGEKVNQFTQRTAITSGNSLNLEDTVFVVPTPTLANQSAKKTLNAMATGAESSSTQIISLPRNINYNPKLQKLYISFH